MKKIFAIILICLTSAALFACGSSSGSNEKNGSSQNESSDKKSSDSKKSSKKDAKSEKKKKNSKATEESSALPAGKVLIDDDIAYIEFTGTDDSWMGYELKLSIENRSDQNICIQTNDFSINGYMLDMFDATMSSEVNPGKKAKDEITLMSSPLEEIGINSLNDIKEMQWTFHIFDSDSWKTIEDIPVSLKV